MSIRKTLFFNQSLTLNRPYSFTDGIHGIVLTLLVLGLKFSETPGLTGARIIDELVRQIPNFFS